VLTEIKVDKADVLVSEMVAVEAFGEDRCEPYSKIVLYVA